MNAFRLWAATLWMLAAASADAAAPAVLAARLWAVPGDFVDDGGQAVRLDAYAGVPTVVAMEYTACRFVCSTAWRRLMDIQTEADRRGLRLRFVVFSLDPANDTPALWREYRQMRGLQRNNWHFLTGRRAATDAVVAQLGVRWWLYDGAIMHELRILRLDEQGRVVKVMQSYDLTPAQFLAD